MLLDGLTKNTALGQALMVRAMEKEGLGKKTGNKHDSELNINWKNKNSRNLFWTIMRPAEKRK